MVEAASYRFVVVGDDSKLVSGHGGSGFAMPVAVVQFCWNYNLMRLQELFGKERCEEKLRLGGDGNPTNKDANHVEWVKAMKELLVQQGVNVGLENSYSRFVTWIKAGLCCTYVFIHSHTHKDVLANSLKLGTMMGVFIPCLQNILGIIYYIRILWSTHGCCSKFCT